MDLWRGFLEGQAGESFEQVGDLLDDQRAFSKLARQVIADLGYGDQLGDDPDQSDEDQEDEAEDGSDDQEDPDSTGQDDQDEEDADADDAAHHEQRGVERLVARDHHAAEHHGRQRLAVHRREGHVPGARRHDDRVGAGRVRVVHGEGDDGAVGRVVQVDVDVGQQLHQHQYYKHSLPEVS